MRSPSPSGARRCHCTWQWLRQGCGRSRGAGHARWALPGTGEPSPLRHLHREPRPVPGHSWGESRPGCSPARPASRCPRAGSAACLPAALPGHPPGLWSLPRPSGRGEGMRRDRRVRGPQRWDASLGLSSLFPCQVGKALFSPCGNAAEGKLLFLFQQNSSATRVPWRS